MIEGTQGWQLFREVLAKAEASAKLFNKSQKLQLAALKRKAGRHDLVADWQPLIDRVFAIWGDALGWSI